MPIEIICFLYCSFFAACVFVYKKFNTMTQHRWSCLVELVRLLSLQYTRCCYVRCLCHPYHFGFLFWIVFFFYHKRRWEAAILFFNYFLDCFSPLLPQAHVRREFVAIFSFNRWHMRQEADQQYYFCENIYRWSFFYAITIFNHDEEFVETSYIW